LRAALDPTIASRASSLSERTGQTVRAFVPLLW
jgi:hypothetical protein